MNVKGSKLGEKVTPIEESWYLCSWWKKQVIPLLFLMNAIPAKVAGVKDIIMTCPPTNGKLNPLSFSSCRSYVVWIKYINLEAPMQLVR